ncbi:MAG: long-chain fatty acid transport protein [Methylophilaceae bacterium]|jgi:long-chain fatty acid transport protein
MENAIRYAAIGFALAASASTQAAGFALIEQSASGMGNAYAGGAAIAEDASTIFFNPAGMTYIEGTQAIGALHLIKPNAQFNDKGSSSGGAFTPLGDEGPNAGDLAFVPNFFFMTALSPSIKVGVGVSVPFGLKTEYDDRWLGRFQASKSELKTININPSIAYKLNDRLSVGAGVSLMRAEATLSRAVNFGAGGVGDVEIKGDDWGFGFNLGAIYQLTSDTRAGVAYRSKVKQKLDGDAKFTRPALVPNAGAAADGDVTAKLDLPETFSVSLFSELNSKWDVMGDVTWTRWSRFEELRVLRESGTTLTVTPENWENTVRYSIGATYHYSDAIKLRAGLAYDEEAIKDEFRTARIPGNDRKWVSLGASYKVTPVSTFDIGYSHLFISDVKIDDNQLAAGNGRLKGEYEGSVDILSLQYTYNF